MIDLKYCVAATALCAAFLVSGIAVANDLSSEVRTVCSKCHSTKRVCANLNVKDETAWKLTVGNMKAKGAPMASNRIEPLAAYLAGLNKGDSAVCE